MIPAPRDCVHVTFTMPRTRTKASGYCQDAQGAKLLVSYLWIFDQHSVVPLPQLQKKLIFLLSEDLLLINSSLIRKSWENSRIQLSGKSFSRLHEVLSSCPDIIKTKVLNSYEAVVLNTSRVLLCGPHFYQTQCLFYN